MGRGVILGRSKPVLVKLPVGVLCIDEGNMVRRDWYVCVLVMWTASITIYDCEVFGDVGVTL